LVHCLGQNEISVHKLESPQHQFRIALQARWDGISARLTRSVLGWFLSNPTPITSRKQEDTLIKSVQNLCLQLGVFLAAAPHFSASRSVRYRG
jgi:hypothetical protein